jgi:elongation factor P--(R)-beta-lysine ligase
MQNLLWQPSASLEVLRQRAAIINKIRQFFLQRNVLEVETPILCRHTITDVHVVGIPAIFKNIGSLQEQLYYLQTSPEYAMKRLLAAGSGAIYQINKAFRQGELGKIHNPEFSILEWYRPGFDHHQLMDEMDELLQIILQTDKAERVSYAELFQQFFNFNPHYADNMQLAEFAKQKNLTIEKSNIANRDTWLDLLWTHCIEPEVGQQRPIFLYDFPASQAALAKVRSGEPVLASRFEVYFKGVELANGFHELQDAAEQAKRFEADLAYRKENNMPLFAMDTFFLAALQQGIPDCSGVALGIDRLIMLALGLDSVAKVVSFSFERA